MCSTNTALLICNTVAVLLLLLFVTWGFFVYIRLTHQLRHICNRVAILRRMDCDQLLQELLSEEEEACLETNDDNVDSINDKQSQHRARLAALVAGGNAKQYLGKQLNLVQVDELSDEEVEKLYSRYEARLGAMMTKTLGSSMLKFYTMVASAFLPIPPLSQEKLSSDLECDPFVNHALTTACCELYHRFGAYLAPITAALTTLKHCEFRQPGDIITDNISQHNDGGYDRRSGNWESDVRGADCSETDCQVERS